MSTQMNEQRRKKIRQATEAIRRAIDEIDYVVSGSLYVRMKPCGKKTCHCAKDPSKRHGPYYEWTRLMNKKMVHTILSEEKYEVIRQAIANKREIKRLLLLWEALSTNEILEIDDDELD